MIITVGLLRADRHRGIGVREAECKKRNEGTLLMLKKLSNGGTTKTSAADFCLFYMYFSFSVMTADYHYITLLLLLLPEGSCQVIKKYTSRNKREKKKKSS